MKAVIIGAGSGFGGRLSVDILSRKPLQDCTIALCDIDKAKLDATAAYVANVIKTHDLKAKLETSTDRTEVLKGADIVVLTVSIGGPAYFDEPFESEINIPLNYGIVQGVGDTVGPGGLFRALRSAPEMLRMIEDINRLAPGALILNYTNPMAILTWLFDEASESPVVGLCHGVTGNSKHLAKLVGVPPQEVESTWAGINHMTWLLEMTHNGKDIKDQALQAVVDKWDKVKDEAPPSHSQSYEYRSQIIKEFGYFTTESDRHFPEYVPYFQHEDRYRMMEYLNITKGVKGKRQKWYEDMGVKAEQSESVELSLSHESMSGIMEARFTGKPFRFSGNVMNTGYISNLPEKSCVEVPVVIDNKNITPEVIDNIPPSCAALNRTNIIFQEMAVNAIRSRSREEAFQALCFDPSTTGVLSLKNIKKMFNDMWKAEEHLLNDYK